MSEGEEREKDGEGETWVGREIGRERDGERGRWGGTEMGRQEDSGYLDKYIFINKL